MDIKEHFGCQQTQIYSMYGFSTLTKAFQDPSTLSARYDSQYILSDSHGRIYNMRDWDRLQVPALAYDSLVCMKPEQSCHMN